MKIICSHCGNEQAGSAGIMYGGRWHNLCHPDKGRDCYRLVTIYGHPPRQCPCVDFPSTGVTDPPGAPF